MTKMSRIMLYKFHPEIPNIPKNLFDFSVEEIRKIPDRFSQNEKSDGSVPTYTLHTAPDIVEEFLKPYFDDTANFAIQLITHDLPIHKDFGRSECFNYIIDTGGNVSTVWYDDELNQKESIVFPKGKWHSIKVDNFHNVVNVQDTRVAITVWYDDDDAVGELRQ